MKSQWNDSAARETVEAYSAKSVGQDIALRVYTTRLGIRPRPAWRRNDSRCDAPRTISSRR
jgi:hypothetical protein